VKRNICIEKISAKPGEKVTGKIRIDSLANGSVIFLPLTIINGKKEGPTLWLNAAIHGNELNGVFTISEILQKIQPEELNGSIICTPIANPLAYHARNRISELDGLNLGECFPGNPNGQMTERIASILFNLIKKNANYLIDFHAAGAGHTAKPYAVFKLSGKPEIDKKTEEMAMMFGVHLLCKLDLKKALSEPSPLSGSLDINCALNDIPCFMGEIGHAGRYERDIVQFAFNATINVMKHLGCLSGDPKIIKNQVILTERQLLRCNHSGLAILDTKPHELTKKGKRIAHIVNLYGEIIEEVLAPKDVYSISLRYDPVVNAGDRIAFVGSI